MASSSDISTKLEEMMPLIRELLAEGKSIRFSPKGTSMLPMLRQDIDSVILSPLPDRLCKYDLPLYRRANGQYVLHRIIKADQQYTCMGDNQFAPEPGIGQEQMIAVVSAFYRKDQRWDVHAPLYRVYCRFWHYSRPLRHFWRKGISLLRRLLT